MLAALCVLGLLVAGACHFLLPERFAVNAPLRQLLMGRGIDAPPDAALRGRFRASHGLVVSRFATGLPGVRFLRPTASGDLIASQPRLGRVVLVLRDRDGDGRSDGARELVGGLDRPHGLDLHDGWLYVGESGGVGRIRFDETTGQPSGSFEQIITGLPAGGNHWTRTVRVGPDGWLYVSVGSSCNVCIEEDPRRAAILRYRPDGSDEEIFATGLRNSVGFDWRPETGEMFATDNGRDLLGDDFPPCELNLIERGQFYGWPVANGYGVPDPDFGSGRDADIARTRPPVFGFGAHNAPLGMTFLRSSNAPPGLRGAALVALHGSWNRTRKSGYKVVALLWDDRGDIHQQDLLTGFEVDEDVVGRPVDVTEGVDGAIYVSDDYAGSIHRLSMDAPDRPVRDESPSVERREFIDPDAEAFDEMALRGRVLFDQLECAGCHDAARATPGVVVKPLAGLARRYAPEQLDAFLVAPMPPMPAFPLNQDQRADLAVHLRRAYR